MEFTRLMRLMEAQEKVGDKAYTLEDLFALIDRGVFLNYSTSKPVGISRARLQHNIVKEFLTACLKLNVTGRMDQLCFYLQDRAEMMTKNACGCEDSSVLQGVGRDDESEMEYRGECS